MILNSDKILDNLKLLNHNITSNAEFFVVLLSIMGDVRKIDISVLYNFKKISDVILETNLTKSRIRKKLRKKIISEE